MCDWRGLNKGSTESATGTIQHLLSRAPVMHSTHAHQCTGHIAAAAAAATQTSCGCCSMCALKQPLHRRAGQHKQRVQQNSSASSLTGHTAVCCRHGLCLTLNNHHSKHSQHCIQNHRQQCPMRIALHSFQHICFRQHCTLTALHVNDVPSACINAARQVSEMLPQPSCSCATRHVAEHMCHTQTDSSASLPTILQPLHP
ncbi:hypothetical protein COO60DRAFT_724008 [Scenedesmus sp. NREL 46B-D3]|nr:hypothetical protein COO60DRAFT_724008 [Scenedesmus sp. NREL 46B-D3]